MNAGEFWDLVEQVVRNFYAQDGDWAKAMDRALQHRTKYRLVDEDLLGSLLERTADAPEPVKVIINVDRGGAVKVIKPDHVEAEVRNYAHGDDCQLCGKYHRFPDMRKARYGPANSSMVTKAVHLCETCFKARMEDAFFPRGDE